jgi:RimJ/RimL family protein N-acetyltransferase
MLERSLVNYLGIAKSFPHIFYMITIKKFKNEDVDYILRWFANGNNRKFQRTKIIDREGALKLVTSSADKIVYCIFLDQEPIGYAMIKGIPDKPQIGINIDEPFWGKGYGFEAMQLLEKEAKDKGCRKISLLVNEQNLRAINLYKKLNYTDTNLKLMEKEI